MTAVGHLSSLLNPIVAMHADFTRSIYFAPLPSATVRGITHVVVQFRSIRRGQLAGSITVKGFLELCFATSSGQAHCFLLQLDGRRLLIFHKSLCVIPRSGRLRDLSKPARLLWFIHSFGTEFFPAADFFNASKLAFHSAALAGLSHAL